MTDIFRQLGMYIQNGSLPEWGYWTYLLLAMLVAVEGPVATLLGAAAASVGVMRPFLVFAAAAFGNLTADTLWYLLGYMGKVEWLSHFGWRVGVNPKILERLQKGMREHATKILFFAKLSVSLVIPSLIAAGLVKARWRRWFPAVFGAEMIWTGMLVLVGFYATEAIQKVARGLEYLFPTLSLLFVLFMFLMGRHILKENSGEGDEVSAGK